MPKVTLVYKLPEETEEYTLAMNGSALASAVEEFGNELRKITKYDSDNYSAEQLLLVEQLKTRFWELVGEFVA